MTDAETDLPSSSQSLTVLNHSSSVVPSDRVAIIQQACRAWLLKSISKDTRSNYERDLRQFLAFCALPDGAYEHVVTARPEQVAAWRDQLAAQGLTNSSIRRKLTALRSLFSYLQTYGYVGANPAHSDFVAAPSAPRDDKTVGLSPEDCRQLLDVPPLSVARHGETTSLPVGYRDRAIFAVLAFTGCRVGELTRLKVGSYKLDGVHRVLEIHGKGGKERRVPLNPEAAERLEVWLDVAAIRGDSAGPLFRPVVAARGFGVGGFEATAMTRRAVQKLVGRYVVKLGLDPNVTVHSFPSP